MTRVLVAQKRSLSSVVRVNPISLLPNYWLILNWVKNWWQSLKIVVPLLKVYEILGLPLRMEFQG